MPTQEPVNARERDRRRRQVVSRSKAAKVQLVRFLYCGNDSVIRGKACHVRFLDSAAGYAFIGGVLAHLPALLALVDPDTLSGAERERMGIRRLPRSLDEALDALERDEVLRAALGEVLAREYLIVKRSEARGFEGKGVDFEIEHHFFKY